MWNEFKVINKNNLLILNIFKNFLSIYNFSLFLFTFFKFSDN